MVWVPDPAPSDDGADDGAAAEHGEYATRLLSYCRRRLLGRRTYQGLSAGYMSMPANLFVDRMNSRLRTRMNGEDDGRPRIQPTRPVSQRT